MGQLAEEQDAQEAADAAAFAAEMEQEKRKAEREKLEAEIKAESSTQNSPQATPGPAPLALGPVSPLAGPQFPEGGDLGRGGQLPTLSHPAVGGPLPPANVAGDVG